jgi:hypothetical protein
MKNGAQVIVMAARTHTHPLPGNHDNPGLGRCSETAATRTTSRLDTRLADEAVKVLGVKSRTEAAGVALREIVSLQRPEA